MAVWPRSDVGGFWHIGTRKSASVELSRMLSSFRCIQTLLAVQKSGSGKSANRKQFNRRLWRWLHLSRKCHAKGGKRRQKSGKQQQRKKKPGCVNFLQLPHS